MSGPRVEDVDLEEFAGMQPGPFFERIGLEFDLVTPDRLEAHLETGPQHHQPYGIVHGGVYASIVETLGSMGAALAAQRHGDLAVGVSNTTDFVRAHRRGRLDVVATPIQSGRLQQLWQVDIRRHTDGGLVAQGRLRAQVLPPDRIAAAGRAGDGTAGDGAGTA